jgi:hypothetical protein
LVEAELIVDIPDLGSIQQGGTILGPSRKNFAQIKKFCGKNLMKHQP